MSVAKLAGSFSSISRDEARLRVGFGSVPMTIDMQKPKSTRIATGHYPRRPFGGNSGIRKQSQRTRTSYAYLRRQKWAKNKTSYVSSTGRDEGTEAQHRLEPMVVDSGDKMNKTLAGGDDSNPDVPDIVIHPPSDDGDVDMERKDEDVETLCARIDAQLAGVFETKVSRDARLQAEADITRQTPERSAVQRIMPQAVNLGWVSPVPPE
ncbi:hypothetical protein BGZ61DRAFT_487705 [Ilyonectria robusta]|uniref:uncharacterized protein n=1 Tax=Ilyonectria robusta TaxID=1079257 RepID=UPI001E8DFD4F|nr:uncharacterized protein BGZ61DRAFT_487705 [Ilyonectria robusta]KAH8650782.1 hypothetical protein BGZ61DRAFT_487705 [Ilyonectria robusta]